MYSDKMQKCTILHYHIYSAEILLHSEKGEDERGERESESERGERDRERWGRVDHREQGERETASTSESRRGSQNELHAQVDRTTTQASPLKLEEEE